MTGTYSVSMAIKKVLGVSMEVLSVSMAIRARLFRLPSVSMAMRYRYLVFLWL